MILVDDGIATGATVRAAVEAIRAHRPASVVVAAPVAPAEVVGELAEIADRVVMLVAAKRFGSVGRFYDDLTSCPTPTSRRCYGLAADPAGVPVRTSRVR